jgi:N utilization substance protein A
VPDDQLSLAIGKKGQNVRLAARLTGWNIDIKSETRAAEAAKDVQEETDELKEIPADEMPSEELSEIEVADAETAPEGVSEELKEATEANEEGSSEDPTV